MKNVIVVVPLRSNVIDLSKYRNVFHWNSNIKLTGHRISLGFSGSDL